MAAWDAIVEQYRGEETVVWQSQQIAALAFPVEVCEQLELVRDTYSKIRLEIYTDPDSYLKREKDLNLEQDKLAQMIKDDLGLSESEEE